ncbi:MAG: hypothetical protein SFZ03_01860 [Candidatus Melainabacteria bacterium]|nr:hypothetical protein [Candidatus Melainabacteria bacterium]
MLRFGVLHKSDVQPGVGIRALLSQTENTQRYAYAIPKEALSEKNRKQPGFTSGSAYYFEQDEFVVTTDRQGHLLSKESIWSPGFMVFDDQTGNNHFYELAPKEWLA